MFPAELEIHHYLPPRRDSTSRLYLACGHWKEDPAAIFLCSRYHSVMSWLAFTLSPNFVDTLFLLFCFSLIRLFASNGDEITPRIIQPIAANGGSVHPLIEKLLRLNATIAAIPPQSRGRVTLSNRTQLRIACNRPYDKRAMNIIRTGRPAIAPSSIYEL